MWRQFAHSVELGSTADTASAARAASRLQKLISKSSQHLHPAKTQAFARWRNEHAATARAVRAALQGGPAQEAQLRTLADEARSQLWGLFQVRAYRSLALDPMPDAPVIDKCIAKRHSLPLQPFPFYPRAPVDEAGGGGQRGGGPYCGVGAPAASGSPLCVKFALLAPFLFIKLQMKRAVAYSEGVGLIAGLAHLPPVERPFAWLGSGPLRPSDAAGSLLERLQLPNGGGGDDDGRAAMQLQILKVCHTVIARPCNMLLKLSISTIAGLL